MYINIKSVVIEVVILHVLQFIGGFVPAFILSTIAGSPTMPSRGIALLVDVLMLTIGFIISGYRNPVRGWKHLFTVAICFWLTDAGIRCILSGLPIGMPSMLMLFLVFITMGIGGFISLGFVQTPKETEEEQIVSSNMNFDAGPFDESEISKAKHAEVAQKNFETEKSPTSIKSEPMISGRLEKCSNCNRLIGKLEHIYMIDGNVVCVKCYQVLNSKE